MEASIIAIGNSKGIRLSKHLIERYNLKEKVELLLEENQIIIRPVQVPRKGWDEAFKKMHEAGDDALLMDDVFEREDFEEWK